MRQPLDRETQDLIEVIISITDEGIAGSEPNTVSLRREITILDENDNVPEFHNRPYSANISESSPIGSTILLPKDIIVTDNDGGINADVTVSCFVEPNMLYIDDVCETFNVWIEKVTQNSNCLELNIKSVNTRELNNFPLKLVGIDFIFS